MLTPLAPSGSMPAKALHEAPPTALLLAAGRQARDAGPPAHEALARGAIHGQQAGGANAQTEAQRSLVAGRAGRNSGQRS
jgi:hypothetical protein